VVNPPENGLRLLRLSLHEYAASGYGLFPFVPPARRSTFGNSRSLGHRVFSHAFANSQLYLRSDAAFTM
jgi:hypothetical protein